MPYFTDNWVLSQLFSLTSPRVYVVLPLWSTGVPPVRRCSHCSGSWLLSGRIVRTGALLISWSHSRSIPSGWRSVVNYHSYVGHPTTSGVLVLKDLPWLIQRNLLTEYHICLILLSFHGWWFAEFIFWTKFSLI